MIIILFWVLLLAITVVEINYINSKSVKKSNSFRNLDLTVRCLTKTGVRFSQKMLMFNKILRSVRNIKQETIWGVIIQNQHFWYLFLQRSSNIIALLVFSKVTLLALMVPNPWPSSSIINSVSLNHASNIKCSQPQTFFSKFFEWKV